jgi:protein-S-isoprenylcysteine O-methyltransferase Ste14
VNSDEWRVISEGSGATLRFLRRKGSYQKGLQYEAMTHEDTIHQDHSGSDATQEVANLGRVRPPLVYGASIVIGLLLEFGWPRPFLPRILAAPLGSFLVVVAVIIFAYSIRTFRAAGTPVPGNQPSIVIVRTGPYRFSRNPIYLAFSLLQLGIAIWVNSVWLIATLLAAVALMAFVVIPREERYLERKFGADYLDYKRSVRRWF